MRTWHCRIIRDQIIRRPSNKDIRTRYMTLLSVVMYLVQMIQVKRDIQAYHHWKDNDRVTIKFSNRKDSLHVLRVKKDLKSLDPTELDFPEGTRIFINESLCAYYRGLWNKCKKLKGMGKLHVFFVSNGTIKVKMLENDQAKPISHASDLKKIFTDINVDNCSLQGAGFFSFFSFS